MIEAPFKFMLVGSYVFHALYHWSTEKDLPYVVSFIGEAGFIIFGYYIFRLYMIPRKGLITSGLFRYTRHPMYTGILLMGLERWWPTSAESLVEYLTTLALFLVGVFVAGYLQEKETLARFGDEAVEYYRKTPRCFLFYFFRRRT